MDNDISKSSVSFDPGTGLILSTTNSQSAKDRKNSNGSNQDYIQPVDEQMAGLGK